jgi:hypothetical protein
VAEPAVPQQPSAAVGTPGSPAPVGLPSAAVAPAPAPIAEITRGNGQPATVPPPSPAEPRRGSAPATTNRVAGGFAVDSPEIPNSGLEPANAPPRPLTTPLRVGGGNQARTAPPIAPLNRHPPSAKALAAARAVPTGNQILDRAKSAFNKGDYPEAVRRGKEAIGAGAASGGHLLLGDAYYHLERYTDAAREYQATLALDPGNAQARRGRDLARQAASSAAATP